MSISKEACAWELCDRRTRTRGFCDTHYHAARRLGIIPMKLRPISDEERFWSKVNKTSECWQWTGYLGNLGYGQFKLDGTMKKSHRIAWEMSNGPIPSGKFIDHICHNRGCVNPDHLRPVTPKGNIENHDGRAKSHNKLGVRGVSWNESKQCYVAQVRHNKKTYGRDFTNLAEASAYVVRLRNSLHTFNDRDRAGK